MSESLTKHTGHLVEGLVWTKEKPIVPGWYWWSCESHEAAVVEVTQGGAKLIAWMTGTEESFAPLDMPGQWLGPIPQPTDPPSQAFVSVPLAEADLARIRETSLRAAEKLKP